MHKLAEKIADCMKAKVEAKGIDNIEGQDLVELGMWTDIIKDLVCYDKDKKIIEAMDEAEESEEAMKYIEMYEDYPRRGYRGQPRSKTSGRFMSRRDGRRNYEEPMYYSMTPEMYHMYPSEYYRDMDREDMGRMYYSGGPSSGNASSMGGQSSSGMNDASGNKGYTDSRQSDGGNYSSRMQRDGREGRSGEARRGYMETKEMHKGNSADDKQHKMKELENYMKELSTDITEMISDASSEEKNMLKNKLQVLMQKIN